MPFCQHNAKQLSQKLFCVKAVSAVSFESHSMSISCGVAFSLLVQVCPGWQSGVQERPAVLHLHVFLV